ncbi:MAG: hypothetical protein MRZ79_03320 [Bacteroidia bacterium]|nr:hypothetical protein [Bacteroidia bacterium]
MKKQFTTILFMFLFALVSQAQVHDGINYQAVVKLNDQLARNTALEVRFTISTGTNSLYQETQQLNTTEEGVLSAVIGKGTALSGTFSAIDWSQSGAYLLNVSVKTSLGGSFIDLGTQEMVSTPFSLYSKKADVARVVENDKVNDADASPSNEIQTLNFSTTSKNLSLSRNGGSVNLSSLEDVESGADWRAYPSKTINSSSVSSLGSITITAPKSGYVLVTATGQGALVTLSTVDFKIGFGTTSSTYYTSMTIKRVQSTSSGITTIRKDISLTYVLPVSAGINTIYFNGNRSSGYSGAQMGITDLKLTALFVPNRY